MRCYPKTSTSLIVLIFYSFHGLYFIKNGCIKIIGLTSNKYRITILTGKNVFNKFERIIGNPTINNDNNTRDPSVILCFKPHFLHVIGKYPNSPELKISLNMNDSLHSWQCCIQILQTPDRSIISLPFTILFCNMILVFGIFNRFEVSDKHSRTPVGSCPQLHLLGITSADQWRQPEA